MVVVVDEATSIEAAVVVVVAVVVVIFKHSLKSIIPRRGCKLTREEKRKKLGRRLEIQNR